jgi:AcrR family transcriptional regulator
MLKSMGRVKTYDDKLRQRLVDEGGRLLSEEGVAALTLRRVAARAETSTTAVYSLFGDKDGLLTAMYTEGFDRLGTALDRARRREKDPLAALAAAGLAYRSAALKAPHLYSLMFGKAAPGFAPDPTAAKTAEAAFTPLVEAVQACLDDGQLVAPAADPVARYLWAVSHGMVSLELAGLGQGSAKARTAAYKEGLVLSALPYLPGDARAGAGAGPASRAQRRDSLDV